ncbi:hypothetical protein [Lutimaribacter saemankumensis]|uniref:Uncharacterized protein n=1 Tax=Lutimaribacter saemankumensis TaxID=490829 RepID=A0A1G8RCT4_9RHOB|nr:hypothetical protein [Lutimaribacter saemankumensis]SDJ14741.1 hypothetical protein SAMN05421850_10964 [Lutimaribacter saemankumensis]
MSKPPEKANTKAGVTFNGTPEGGQKVVVPHEAALMEIFNTSDDKQAEALTRHCLKTLKNREASDEHPGEDERQFMLSIIKDLEPRDAVERMLVVQMAATHVAMIRSARWLAGTETLPQVQAHYTGYNKLARTYAAQVEALRKYRNGGRQTVTVQHVNVEDGGQAIVGNVQHGGRVEGES